MTINIDFKDRLDVRDLADIAETAYGILADPESAVEFTEDACDTLDALQEMLLDFGMTYMPYTEVAKTLRGLSVSTNPTMYTPEAFVEAVREYVEDVRNLPRDMPKFVAIDWKTTAENVQREQYSKVYLDGNEYLMRRRYLADSILP